MAQAGVRMLEEAVEHYVRQHPEGVTSRMIHDEMGVERPNPAGHWKDNLVWGLISGLRAKGKLRRDESVRPALYFWVDS
jgi:hypothetical protein